MDKKNIIFVIALMLIGCSMTKDNPPTNHDVTCSNIEHKLVFAKGNEGFKNADWNSPAQQAQLLREYDKYDCANKL